MIARLALALSLLAAPAYAASFDCAAARAPVERMICGDAALSHLDDDLAAAYATAVDAVPRVDLLRAEQREWIAKRDKATDVSVMRTAYQERITALRQATDVARKLRVEIDADALGHCIALRDDPDESCTVDESGAVDGDPTLAYQAQSYRAGDLRTGGGVVVLRRQASGRLLPILWDSQDQAHYGQPGLVASPAGALLQVPGDIEGTGNFSAESLYRLADSRWRAIDIESWQADLGKRLPAGLAVWKGMYPDWAKMTVETSLWRAHDGNCCPTGGSAYATLALQGDRIVLTEVRVSPKPLP
jgi:uncharacterized protein YecT (DUF1311 family)